MPLDMELDLIGTQPALFGLYTQLAFVFHVPQTMLHTTFVSSMLSGLDRLGEAFPWTAGQVVKTSSRLDNTPSHRIQPFESAPKLTVKDYRNDTQLPTFAQMEEAGYPMSMLDESVWAPCPTIASSAFDPSKSSGMGDNPAPVMLVQLSIIRDGLVLCINMQHNVCDMIGQAAVMGWLSKACRQEEFTQEELDIGNADRRTTIPPLSQEILDVQDDLKHQLLPIEQRPGGIAAPMPTELEEGAPTPAPPQCSWTYFKFSSASLQELKSIANAGLPEGFASFVSTDDALSAFIFKSLLRARSHRLPSETLVTLARAVDARRYLNVRADYPGIMQNMTYTSYLLSELMALPLGHIAAALRDEVNPETSSVARRTQSLIAFLSQDSENASKVSFTAKQDSGADLALSSWSKVPAYHWDFGFSLGPAAAVRRPRFVPVESLIYLMPKDPNESVAVAVCLRQQDIDCLERDNEWNRTTTCDGSRIRTSFSPNRG